MNLLQTCDPPVVEDGYNTGASQVIRQVRRQFPVLGHTTTVVTKEIFADVPPGESAYERVAAHFDSLSFDHVHIATEGRLGFLARWYCIARGLRYTSAWYAQYPEFMQIRHGTDPTGPYEFLKWYHQPAAKVIVPTQSMAQRIQSHGVKNVVTWPFGVDIDLFRPPPNKRFLDQYPRPIWLYVGRLDPEKSIEQFLELELEGTKLVVGDGSIREQLQRQFPNAVFVGLKLGEELVQYYGAADVFVFPSKTDTFGLVLVEALACGVPVAAYRAIGPLDIVTSTRVGCLNDDLHVACLGALNLLADDCAQFAQQYSWVQRARDFIALQVPCGNRVSCVLRHRFEAVYGPRLRELEQMVVDTEDMLFGAKAHNLTPDRSQATAEYAVI
jgi:glycosyltransferase involved in cell wall biosynthesis